MNNFHSPFLDWFFPKITQIAELWGILFFFILSSLTKIKNGLIFLFSLGLSSGITFLLKLTFFNDHLRPSEYLKEVSFHKVANVDLHTYYSFPSGHTTAAFAMFSALAFCTSNKWLKMVYLLLAFITGYSRIYLSQHFLKDVVAGAFIGICTAVFVFIVFQNKNILKKDWLNYSLLCK